MDETLSSAHAMNFVFKMDVVYVEDKPSKQRNITKLVQELFSSRLLFQLLIHRRASDVLSEILKHVLNCGVPTDFPETDDPRLLKAGLMYLSVVC